MQNESKNSKSEKEGSKVSIKGKERLLTDAEKEVILKSYENYSILKLLKIYIIAFIPIIILLSFLWGSIWSKLGDIQKGLIAGTLLFVIMNLIILVYILKSYNDFKLVVNKIKLNELYTKEAIYDYTTGKYHITFLEIIINGKRTYKGYNLVLREVVKKGEKVILLQKKGTKWLYKARD